VTDQPQTPEPGMPAPAGSGSSPTSRAPEPTLPTASTDAGGAARAQGSVVDDRPEIAVGAAFAGGFVLAMILRRLAG
jgi:hypothetical protein